MRKTYGKNPQRSGKMCVGTGQAWGQNNDEWIQDVIGSSITQSPACLEGAVGIKSCVEGGIHNFLYKYVSEEYV